MNSLCILTDSSAQFIDPQHEHLPHLNIIPHKIYLNGHMADSDTKVTHLPRFATDSIHPQAKAPSVEDFRQRFIELSKNYNEILCLLISSQLSDCVQNAVQAAATIPGGVSIQIIDSQTTSLGLGFLTASALAALSDSKSTHAIERQIRNHIHHLFSVICTPGLSYLYYNGFVDRGQAIVCEMLDLYPIFGIENGRLAPMVKVRNRRQVLNFFLEYLSEFDNLNHIALLDHNTTESPDHKYWKESLGECTPKTPHSIHAIPLPMATLFGPNTLALFVMENQSA